jgi:hypothetical protein
MIRLARELRSVSDHGWINDYDVYHNHPDIRARKDVLS